jgi:hypothetical protein
MPVPPAGASVRLATEYLLTDLDLAPAEGYEPPGITDMGHVRELTRGSSSSGKADANSQYYW